MRSDRLQRTVTSTQSSKPLIHLSLLQLAYAPSGSGPQIWPPSGFQPSKPAQPRSELCLAQHSFSRLGQGETAERNSCHLFYLEPDPCPTMQPGTEEDRPTFDKVCSGCEGDIFPSFINVITHSCIVSTWLVFPADCAGKCVCVWGGGEEKLGHWWQIEKVTLNTLRPSTPVLIP